jgi:uncharacterized membrane protein
MAPFGSSFDDFAGPNMLGVGAALTVLRILVAGLIMMWIILIIAARFLKKGYEGITAKTGMRYSMPSRNAVTFFLKLTTPGN